MKTNTIRLVLLACCLLSPSAFARRSGRSGGVPFSRPARTMRTPAARTVPRTTPDTARSGPAGTREAGRQAVAPAPRPARAQPPQPRPAPPSRPVLKPHPSSGTKAPLRDRPSVARPDAKSAQPPRAAPRTYRPAPPAAKSGSFAPPHRPPPSFAPHRSGRHPPHRSPARHTPFHATSHHVFFNTWGWDPYGEAFVPATLNPVFDPWWGWRGVGGVRWERAYATSYGYGLGGVGYYPGVYAAGRQSQRPATGTGAEENRPEIQETAPPGTADPESIRATGQTDGETDDLFPPGCGEDPFDDLYGAFLLESVPSAFETRSWYTETLDPARILRSYHGLDQEDESGNPFTDE